MIFGRRGGSPESDPDHRAWEAMVWERVEPRIGRTRMERVLHLLPQGGRHLDVGTGNGDGTALAGRIARCTGIEYGFKNLLAAAAKGCVVVQGDARRLPLAWGSFDSVTCLDVLEHILGPAAAVTEIARALRPGGLLVVQTPNREILKERLLRLARSLGYPQRQPYDLPLPLGDIRRLLREANLVVARYEPIRCWDPNPLVRTISWSRLLECRKPS